MIANGSSAESPVAVDESRKLVKRVVKSATFAKSKRLAEFLEHICNFALDGRVSELNEQRIGVDLFGRSDSYDSSNDGIVRTHASRLRQRLERYFEEEGIDEPVRIVLPRGKYVPLFQSRFEPPRISEAVHLTDIEPLPPLKSTTPSLGKVARVPYWAWGGFAVLLVALLALFKHNGLPEKADSSTHSSHLLWSSMFASDSPTLLVPGDNGLVIWQGLMNRNLSLVDFLNGDYRAPVAASAMAAEKIASDLSNRRYTSIVDLQIAQFLVRRAQSEKGSLVTRYARDIRPDDLRQNNNIILIGVREANPWVELFEPNMNFVYFADRAHHIFSIVNRHPRGNEPREWIRGSDHVYAIAAYLKALDGKRNALILGGTSMAGTECALNLVAEDTELSSFLTHIRRPDGSIPHFEAVLGTKAASGTALKGAVLAWRVFED